MAIEVSVGDISIVKRIPGPSKGRPHKLSNCCVRVPRFTYVEVAAVAEEVPFDGADDPGLAGLTVEFSKFIARVSNEDRSKTLLNILEISSRSKLTDRATKSSRSCASNAIACANASIGIYLRS